MSLPPFHPFSLDYTADPRPWFREAHRDNRILEVPELGAVAVHGYEAVRSFCDHPQMSRNPLHAATYDADRAAYADSRIVLFFHAPWCPNCRATEESLNADGVPDGLTIVKVDFDSQTDLRQEYGVTYQHTYVLVDTDGTALKKWTGTETGADIAAEAA